MLNNLRTKYVIDDFTHTCSRFVNRSIDLLELENATNVEDKVMKKMIITMCLLMQAINLIRVQ